MKIFLNILGALAVFGIFALLFWIFWTFTDWEVIKLMAIDGFVSFGAGMMIFMYISEIEEKGIHRW